MKTLLIVVLFLFGVIGVTNAQTQVQQKMSKEEKKFIKTHKRYVKEFNTENHQIQMWYKCENDKDDATRKGCYEDKEKAFKKNLKWFEKKEARLIKKYGDGVSVYAYKY